MSNVIKETDKKSFQDVWQIGLRLLIICAVVALLLGVIKQFTATAITERLAREKKEVMTRMVQDSIIGKAMLTDDQVVQTYYPVKKNGQLTGYILELLGSGYGDRLKLLALYAPTGEIRKVQLLEHNETPGLGDKAQDPAYMWKFIGTGATEPVPVTKAMLLKKINARQAYVRPVYHSFTEWLFGKQESLTGAGTDIDSVSGATITFKGIAQALARGALFVRDMRGNS
jgi:electron transport complex protein RnfG